MVGRPGPSIFRVMGRGPARPIPYQRFSAQPGLAHRFFNCLCPAGPGPDHNIGSETRETRALYGPARHFVGLPAYMTG